MVYRRVREAVVIAEAEGEGVRGGAVAGTGSSGLYKVAVTSMHICARIFAWAWDLLVGSAAYPMQQVSLSSAPNSANVKVAKRVGMAFYGRGVLGIIFASERKFNMNFDPAYI